MTTILAIDDEPNNLKLIQMYLADTDYRIMTALNGAEGLQVLSQHHDHVDVILLDRMMPVMDGMEFMVKLRENDTFTHLPVIM